MKATCTPAFATTLEACGLTYTDWRHVCRVNGRRHRPTRWVRQFVRKVQRVHTGGGMWRGGRYIRREMVA